MIRYLRYCILLAGVSLSGCTSDPSAPVNQAFPIRQMDQFFGSLSAPAAPPVDYTRQPGYAPAYPEVLSANDRGPARGHRHGGMTAPVARSGGPRRPIVAPSEAPVYVAAVPRGPRPEGLLPARWPRHPQSEPAPERLPPHAPAPARAAATTFR